MPDNDDGRWLNRADHFRRHSLDSFGDALEAELIRRRKWEDQYAWRVFDWLERTHGVAPGDLVRTAMKRYESDKPSQLYIVSRRLNWQGHVDLIGADVTGRMHRSNNFTNIIIPGDEETAVTLVERYANRQEREHDDERKHGSPADTWFATGRPMPPWREPSWLALDALGRS